MFRIVAFSSRLYLFGYGCRPVLKSPIKGAVERFALIAFAASLPVVHNRRVLFARNLGHSRGEYACSAVVQQRLPANVDAKRRWMMRKRCNHAQYSSSVDVLLTSDHSLGVDEEKVTHPQQIGFYILAGRFEPRPQARQPFTTPAAPLLPTIYRSAMLFNKV